MTMTKRTYRVSFEIIATGDEPRWLGMLIRRAVRLIANPNREDDGIVWVNRNITVEEVQK